MEYIKLNIGMTLTVDEIFCLQMAKLSLYAQKRVAFFLIYLLFILTGKYKKFFLKKESTPQRQCSYSLKAEAQQKA